MRVGGSAIPDDPGRIICAKVHERKCSCLVADFSARGIARPTRCCFIQTGGRSTDLVAADWFARPMIRFRPLRSHADHRAVRGIDDLPVPALGKRRQSKLLGSVARESALTGASVRRPIGFAGVCCRNAARGVARSSATFRGRNVFRLRARGDEHHSPHAVERQCRV